MESERNNSWSVMVTLGSFTVVACSFLFVGIAIGWFFGEREREAIREENKKLETRIEDLEIRSDNPIAKRFMEAFIKSRVSKAAESANNANEPSPE